MMAMMPVTALVTSGKRTSAALTGAEQAPVEGEAVRGGLTVAVPERVMLAAALTLGEELTDTMAPGL